MNTQHKHTPGLLFFILFFIVSEQAASFAACQQPAGSTARPGTGIIVEIEGDTVVPRNQVSNLTVSATDEDEFWNVLLVGHCEDGVKINSIDWGDGTVDTDVAGMSASHTFLEAKDYAVKFYVDDLNNFGDGNDPVVEAGIKIIVTDGPTSCNSCQGGTGNACNLSAAFYTDPWGTGPSGVTYSSHQSKPVYAILPFGDYVDSYNRGWRMHEDGHAVLRSDSSEDYLELYWAGRLFETFVKVSGVYHSTTSDATAKLLNGRVDIYVGGHCQVRYGQQVQQNVHYMITAATDEWGGLTTFEYDTGGDPAVRLKKMTMPEGRFYEYTWIDNATIGRKVLDNIETSDGHRMKFVYDTGEYRLKLIRWRDLNPNPEVTFREVHFFNSATSGYTQLITSFQTNAFSNGTFTHVFFQDLDYEDANGRVTVNKLTNAVTGEVRSSTMTWTLQGFETGSDQQVDPAKFTSKSLIKDLGGDEGLYVAELWSPTGALVHSATKHLADMPFGRILSATYQIAGVTPTTANYVYDASENLIEQHHPGGRVVLERDNKGQVTSEHYIKDIGGVTETASYTEWDYDNNGRNSEIRYYDTDLQETLRGEFEQNADGYTTQGRFYDGFALLFQTNSEYDIRGRKVETVDGEGRAAHFKYDERGRLSETGIEDATTTRIYNNQGRMVAALSPRGATTEYDHDLYGRTTAVTRYVNVFLTPTPVITQYAYDDYGYGQNLTRITDPRNQKVEFDYDDLGRQTAEVLFAGIDPYTEHARNKVSYDEYGRVSASTDFNGVPSLYEYEEGRYTTQVWNNEPSLGGVASATVVYDSNPMGQTSKVTIEDASGCGCSSMKYYGYDERGRLAEHTAVIEDTTFYYVYDDRNGMISEFGFPLSATSGYRLEYSYDAIDRLVSMKKAGTSSNLLDFQYDKASYIRDVTMENGAMVHYAYNAYGRISSVTNEDGGGNVMSAFTYTYDLDGRVTRIDREDGSYISYQYDDLDRLTWEEKKNMGGSLVWRNRYEYDMAGNRLKWHKNTGGATSTYEYKYTNGLNQMAAYSVGPASSTFTYDKNGNMTKQELRWSGTLAYSREFKWNQDNRLIGYRTMDGMGQVQKTVEYRYCRTCNGPRTERIEKNNTGYVLEHLRYDMEGLNHTRIDELVNGQWRPQRYYVNKPGSLGQIVKAVAYDYQGGSPATKEYYYGYDALGNTSVISDATGDEIDQFEQDAFGNQVENSWLQPAGEITEHLTTKQFDSDLGMYYFNARWYDPIQGRFVSMDQARDGTNHYAFVDNNPLMKVDPSGNCPQCSDCVYTEKYSTERYVCCAEAVSSWCDQFKELPYVYNNCMEHNWAYCDSLGLDPTRTPTPTFTPTPTRTYSPTPTVTRTCTPSPTSTGTPTPPTRCSKLPKDYGHCTTPDYCSTGTLQAKDKHPGLACGDCCNKAVEYLYKTFWDFFKWKSAFESCNCFCICASRKGEANPSIDCSDPDEWKDLPGCGDPKNY